MSCVDPETLSRWTDGTLGRAESRAVERHVAICGRCRANAQELRDAAEWLLRATEPGRACLSPEEIAVIVDGGPESEHAAFCPRCAAEIAALRPRKRSTRRITVRRQETPTGWIAAAAGIAIAVIGLVWLSKRPEEEPVARRLEPAPLPLPVESSIRSTPPAPKPPPVAPKAPPELDPLRVEARPLPGPKPPQAPPESPAPTVEPPSPKPAEPAPTPRSTIVEGPAKQVLALGVRSGAISTLVDGKWTGATRILEGMPLRADGKTSIEFSKARLTLESSSRFALSKEEVALSEGAISLDVQQGSGLSLVLGSCRILPMASAGRVLLSAKPDRVVVDEGGARWQEIVLHQGVEHQVVKEKLEPQKRRSLPASLRPRETLTWRPDFKDAAVRSRIQGRIDAAPEGMQVASTPSPDRTYFQSVASFTAQDTRGFFAIKGTSALRFRYFLSEPSIVQLVVKNGTKDENFNLDLDPVVGKWTTATIFFKDIPVNPGGNRTFRFEPGDRIWTVGWFVGKPGSSATLTVDSLEVLEIER